MGNISIQPIASNPIAKTELVELQVQAAQAQAGARIYFQDQAQLRTQDGQTIWLQSIETWCADAIPASFLSTNPVAPIADLQNAAIVFNIGGHEDIHLVPLVSLNRTVTASAPHVRDLTPMDFLYKVDWSKSYVQLAAIGTQTAFSYLFQVRYASTPNVPPGRL